MIKKNFKYIVTSLILAFSMALAFFLILNVIDIVNKYEKQEAMKDRICYSYDEVYTFYNADIEDNKEFFEKVVDISMKFDGIVKLSSGGATFGQANGMASDDVYFSIKEKLYLETSENEIETVEEVDGQNGIYVSESIKEYVEKRDNKEYLLVNNEYYEVLGYLVNRTIEADNTIVLFWDNLSDMQKKQWIRANEFMKSEGLSIRYMSNSKTASKNIESVLNEFLNMGFTYELFDATILEEETYMDDPNVTMVIYASYVLLIFAFISCLYVSALWVDKRKKELIIRKAFGCSIFDIISVLFLDLFKISVIAIFMAVSIQFAYRKLIIKETFLLFASWKSIIMIIAALISVIIISIIIPMIKVIVIKPAKGVK